MHPTIHLHNHKPHTHTDNNNPQDTLHWILLFFGLLRPFILFIIQWKLLPGAIPHTIPIAQNKHKRTLINESLLQCVSDSMGGGELIHL